MNTYQSNELASLVVRVKKYHREQQKVNYGTHVPVQDLFLIAAFAYTSATLCFLTVKLSKRNLAAIPNTWTAFFT
ncbi:unnamed protein product [Prunus armeniaca]